MQLELIIPQNIESDTAKGISGGMVYYVHTGRNAWHSTWVTQYSPGCMHTTLSSAKEYAEALRTRGTVFYIRQLPCLVFRGHGITIVITEINNNNPLGGYSPDATIQDVAAGTKKMKSALDNYLKIGAPLVGVGMSFLPDSRFWIRKPSPRNSVVVLASKNEAISIEKAKSDSLLSWQSFSNGGYYCLGWRSIESHIKRTAVLALYRQAKLKS